MPGQHQSDQRNQALQGTAADVVGLRDHTALQCEEAAAEQGDFQSRANRKGSQQEPESWVWKGHCWDTGLRVICSVG